MDSAVYTSESPSKSNPLLTRTTDADRMILVANLSTSGDVDTHPNLNYTLDCKSLASAQYKGSNGSTNSLSSEEQRDIRAERPNYVYMCYTGHGRLSRYRLVVG